MLVNALGASERAARPARLPNSLTYIPHDRTYSIPAIRKYKTCEHAAHTQYHSRATQNTRTYLPRGVRVVATKTPRLVRLLPTI